MLGPAPHAPPPASGDATVEFRPPLPTRVTDVLARTTLAYLATVEDGAPHLSLMSYTWTDAVDALGPVLVLSTRRATKKFRALTTTPAVAVLVHDYDGVRRGGADGAPAGGGTASVTLYGDAVVLAGGKEEDALRAAHLAANSAYAQFIEGDDIALFYLRPTLARICDIADRVTTWRPAASSDGGGGGGASDNV